MLRKPIEAALFDMDGLLLDTEALYIQAMQAAARRLDLDMPLTLCHAMVGVPGRECNLMIQAFYGEGFSIETFRGHFSTSIRALLDERIPVKPGAVELLDYLEARGLPCAVATSAASRRWQRATMSPTPSPSPTSISRRPGGSASRPRAVSPSRIPTSASPPPTPPAPWPSSCPTSWRRCLKCAPRPCACSMTCTRHGAFSKLRFEPKAKIDVIQSSLHPVQDAWIGGWRNEYA